MLIYYSQTVQSRQRDVIFKTPRLLHNQITFAVNRLHNVEQTVNCGASRSFNLLIDQLKVILNSQVGTG